ncbi:MAG: redoxin domain-containing protein, partial [Woeseiaceae bacterium]
MAATESTMLELGTAAPEFELPTPSGSQVRLADFEGNAGLVVAFICNHCPFVKLIREGLADFAREYSARGVEMVAINSNDFANYSGDTPEKMQDEINEFGYTFPYLVDES